MELLGNRDIHRIGAAQAMVGCQVGGELREPVVERDKGHVGQGTQGSSHYAGADSGRSGRG